MTQPRSTTEWLLIAIAVVTVLSGLVQLVTPDAALTFMGISTSDETVYLFRLVSLLTALFGGALLHTALTGRFERTVLVWAALQKVLSAAAVLLAFVGAILASGTLIVAGYDFLAGLFVFWFWWRRR